MILCVNGAWYRYDFYIIMDLIQKLKTKGYLKVYSKHIWIGS